MNQKISPLDPRVVIHGRTVRQIPLPLFWTASGVELETNARMLAFVLDASFTTREPWVRVEVDGATVLRQPLGCGQNTLTVWRDMTSGSWRRVRLYKETQPMQRDPSSLLTLATIICEGELRAIPPRPYKIEVIGDSISSGEGLAGAVSTKEGVSMVFSTENHYALQTARALAADLRILSQSGWGLLAGWDNDRAKTLPPYYEMVCGLVPGLQAAALGAAQPNDFAAWQPDIVLVHLGYNDGFALDEPPFQDGFCLRRGPDGLPDTETAERFVQCGVAFLKNLRRCNPGARLVWAYGMFGQVMQPYIMEAIRRYTGESGDTVQYVPLPPTPSEQIGANNHPSAAAHTVVAKILSDALRPLLPQ